MKALMKPESSEYFRKIQKPVEDPQTTMNNIEAKKISQEVGIDKSEAKNFQWFFELVAKLKLPQQYSRQLNATKDEVIYFNEKTHQQSTQHPSIHILKIFFYQTLANNKTIYTFLDKQSKLLPFVEQKMLRQSLGLNSKRREAEKVNLMRDESGRMVMSKLEKISPDFKALLASRSYMLKMLVEKVFTRKEIVGKGKRSNAFLSIISQYRQLMKQSTPERQDFEIECEQNLALYQSIFQNCAHYYAKCFGNLRDIPPTIINSREYLESTPQNVLKNIFLLNIDKESIELYWLARMMDCLPLPPNWTKKKGIRFDSYFYQPEKLLFDIHPSYIYIMHQLNTFKSIFKQLGTMRQNYYLNMRQLNFYDFFQRKYTVDMYGYIQNAKPKTQKATKSKQKIELKQSHNSDWLVLEGIKNTPMIPQHYVLVEEIQRFWDCLNFNDEPWCPAISPYGEVVWSSNVNYKSINFNPYRSKLTTLIKNATKNIPAITSAILKPQYKKQQQQIQGEIHLNIEKVQNEREEFLTYYLSHQQKALPWPYEIKEHHSLFDQNNYFDQIFVSPFEFDQGILQEGQPIPLWLEKVKAKQHTIQHTNLLTFNSRDFVAIKSRIAAYALEMVGQHEPHLLEQTQKKINRINNPDDLIKFLQLINDLDLREQRKKEYLESLRKDETDSDIFGSEISQVEVEERLQDENDYQIQPQKQQVKQQVKQASVHQKSIHQLSDEQIIQNSDNTTEIIPQQVKVERQQYEFLQHFIKEKYLRRQQIAWKREEEIEKYLGQAIKSKSKKSKYKRGIIKTKIRKEISYAKGFINNSIFIANEESSQQRKLIKKNLLSTNLRSINFPFDIDMNVEIIKDRFSSQKQDSEFGCSQITDYSPFESQVSDYDCKQIQQMIIEIKKNKKEKEIIKHPTQQSNNQHQQTADTIELEPLHQIKPEINLDPVLRHVKQISGELNQFRSTFNTKVAKSTPKKDPYRDNIRKVQSFKSLSKQYVSTPIPKSNSVKKHELLQSRLSFLRKDGFGSLTKFDSAHKPFHRVCLQKTASHFLQKQVFLKKGDLITMQARKSLLSKGRGIETYISKFY